MSHFIFGDFKSSVFNNKEKENIVKCGKENDVLFWFNDETEFCEDIGRMINENSPIQDAERFCITSVLQRLNSEDLLLPFDGYDNKELFPLGGENRKTFETITIRHLERFEKMITYFKTVVRADKLRFFIVEGYDINFPVIRCSLNEMFADIVKQAIGDACYESKIYQITL